jgi:hypothetical protein
MLRQGAEGRGIIASGTIQREIFQIPHWDPEHHPGGISEHRKHPVGTRHANRVRPYERRAEPAASCEPQLVIPAGYSADFHRDE